jgi:hypothetical protein
MQLPSRFEAPSEWRARFGGFAKKNRVPQGYCDFDAACELAGALFDPAQMEWERP